VTRLASFLACDQVASAGLNKLAYIGLYAGEMIVQSFPLVLPQLFFVVTFRTPIEDKPSQFRVRIERPGHEPFLVDGTDSLSAISVATAPDVTFYQLQNVIPIVPFEMPEAGVVRIFVEHEKGDTYAGGLRIKTGVIPEMHSPQIVWAATMAAAHHQRLLSAESSVQERGAFQLMNALVGFLRNLGIPPTLPAPKEDLRIPIDDKSVRVFYPHPINPTPRVHVEPGPNFDSVTVSDGDDLGFTAHFVPKAPVDQAFSYQFLPPTRRARGKSGN
jgi:hypothetical protein